MLEQCKRKGGITNQKNVRYKSKGEGKKGEENEKAMLQLY